MQRVHQPPVLQQVPVPLPAERHVLIAVEACGVCRTDLHIIDGELDRPKLPLILGHQIVGRVALNGPDASRFSEGALVGVSWLAHVDGTCRYCRAGEENLCDHARFTGYDVDGGYAEYALAHEDFAIALPAGFEPRESAPLMCAGLIGFRSLRMTADAERIGMYGFGAAAHIIAQVARHQGRLVYAFTRPGDEEGMRFAREQGAVWAGGSDQAAPDELDAAIIFAPVGALVPVALRAVRKGGVVVCGGIHMSDIPTFPYRLLWGERRLRSVANLTRDDAAEFFREVERAPVRTHVTTYALKDANSALADVRSGTINGSAVLLPGLRAADR